MVNNIVAIWEEYAHDKEFSPVHWEVGWLLSNSSRAGTSSTRLTPLIGSCGGSHIKRGLILCYSKHIQDSTDTGWLMVPNAEHWIAIKAAHWFRLLLRLRFDTGHKRQLHWQWHRLFLGLVTVTKANRWVVRFPNPLATGNFQKQVRRGTWLNVG